MEKKDINKVILHCLQTANSKVTPNGHGSVMFGTKILYPANESSDVLTNIYVDVFLDKLRKHPCSYELLAPENKTSQSSLPFRKVRWQGVKSNKNFEREKEK